MSDRVERMADVIQGWIDQSDFEAAGVSDIDRRVAQIDLQSEIDPDMAADFWESAALNWERIKDEFGLRTRGETEQLLRDFEEAQLDAAKAEIRDQLDDFGIENVVDAIGPGEPDLPPDQEAELRGRVSDVLEAFPPDIYDAEIENRILNLFNALGEDIQILERDRVEELREQPDVSESEARAQAREEVIQELERALGLRFDSVSDAATRIRQQIAQARGERLRIAPIEVRRSGGDVLFRVEDGEVFQPFEGPARDRVTRELDLSDLGTTWTTVGEIRLRGDDLEAIDLEVGRERFPELEAPQPLEIEQRGAGEQAGLEAATATSLADRFIDLAEGDGG